MGLRGRALPLAALVAAASVVASVCGGGAAARVNGDTTPPSLSIQNVTTPATTDCGSTFCATVSYTYSVSDPDNTPDQITVSCNRPSGSVDVAGQQMVTCQATDPAGNFSPQVMFTVNVTVPPPTFQNVPAPTAVTASSSQGAVVTFVPPTAVDVGGQSVPVNCDHLSGLTYPIGNTTVVCTAQIKRTDSVGNAITGLPSATTQFTVTVSPPASGSGGGGGAASSGGGGTSSGGGGASSGGGGGGTSSGGGGTSSGGGGGSTTGGGSSPGSGTTKDTTAPTLAPHSNLTVAATSRRGATVSYAVSVSDPDNTSGELTVVCAPRSGSTFGLGPDATTKSTTVTCTASDSGGNQAAPLSFEVTVLGVHSQFVALRRSVQSSGTVSRSIRTQLVSQLILAERYFAAGASRSEREQLNAFVRRALGLPASAGDAPARWIEAARRIATVSG